MENNAYVKHILIVDDQAAIRSFLGVGLRRAGYMTSEAQDGAEALLKISADGERRVSYDLVILDINMPYLNGPAVLGILQERGISVPILFISGSSDHEESGSVMNCKPNSSLLQKPFMIEELLSRVEEMISR